ncbi:hypothetical protein PHMEG_00011041 [Phytophthora megakarya]|uniref:RxLR effector PexRD54 WY domain-containing protein n=1 Tax=Phytophthora megakarya TaxID=4795 RepID=A0A225WEN7_9STRA|nr:hypothetical protein PHMEG_00011041 [Phytophthora megakarya]
MLHGWLKDKKTADEAFVRLRLDTTADKLLDQPHFQTWINYANTLNTKTGGKSGSAMSKLTDYYYDAAVARMIESAKKKPGMKEFASDLQTQQFKYWFNGYLTDDPDYVFRALVLAFKVRFRKGNVLDDPLFFTWMNYVKFHDKNTKNQPAGYLTTLKNYYDDGAITILVRMAKKKPSTLEFANKLRDEQIQGWILSGKSPSKVWDIIKGGIVGKKVLGSPEFKALTVYLDRFNKAYPDKKTTSVSILKEYYGKKGPTRAIIEALTSKDPENKNIAKQVETALFGIWLTKYDPTDVFRMLRLNQSPNKLLQNPLLSIWVKYMNAFNSKNPDKRMMMIDTMRTELGDKRVRNILMEAKTDSGLKVLATKLENELHIKLAAEGKTLEATVGVI